MNIANTPIDDLKPYAHNPKLHSTEQIDKIARSITEFGFLVPVLVDADMNIIAGHGRLLAARKLKLTEIPTIGVDHLTKTQIHAYRIADNKLTMDGGWDVGELMGEIADLKLDDYDIDLTGFGEIELCGMENAKNRHDAVFKPGQTSISGEVEFIEDVKDALMADAEAQELFKNRSTILVTFSGGKDSSFALLWAITNFPDKEIVAVFSDTGVELPGMTAHIAECCEFLDVKCETVKPQKDMWTQILKNGWPSIIYHWCQNLLVYAPINIVYQEYDPADVIIVDGSRADQVTRVCKKTKTSKPSDKRMAQYDYYHPSFDIDKEVLEHILEKSGMPQWEGYARGFVRTACWMCPGMCGDQALALSENYPGLTEDIRRWERKIGKPLQQSNDRSIDDLIQTGLRNRAKRDAEALREEMTE